MAVSATTRLADFIAGTHALPADVASRAKLHIGDTLACIYAGAVSRPVEILAKTCRPSNIGTDPAGILVPGLGYWSDPSLAALMTGTCAHADDFDDTSEYSMNGHPSAPIISALLPTALVTGASGEAFVRAYAVGIEVACKIGLAAGPAHTRQGWHTMSTLGTLAAAAAAANLRGLDPARTERALAIACSFAGGLLGNTGTMTKSLHCGRAAQAGYLAAALAADDFTAGGDILEAPCGFLDAFTDRSMSRMTLPPLGQDWEIVTTGLAVKLYPCCSCTHLAIDGARRIRQDTDLDIADIEQVNCYVREECTHYLRFQAPRTGIEAKFSMSYTVSVALVRGGVTLDDFETEALKRDTVAGLLPKIDMRVRADGSDAPDIEVIFKDGSRLAERRSAPRGAPGDPADWGDIAGKLGDGMTRATGFKPADAAQFVKAIEQLDKQARLSDIFTV